MRRSTFVAAALLVNALSSTAFSAPFDGSQPFICAAIEVFSCVTGTDCERETAESINVPQFLLVDVQKKEVSGARVDGTVRTSPITFVQAGSSLDIHGTENQFGWNMIVEPSGKMTLTAAGTVAGDRTALVVFGACTPRDAFDAAVAR